MALLEKNCLWCAVKYTKPPRASMKQWEKRNYCTKSCAQRNRTDERAAHWGVVPTYASVHLWVKRKRGKASMCSNKSCPGISKTFQWANISEEYKRDINDWVSLCASCHQYFDRKNVCSRGHQLTPDNAYWHPQRHRRACKTCMRAASKRYREKARVVVSHS